MGIGIYGIKNLVNNKIYIGSSIDIERRWKEHKSRLKNNSSHCNFHLQNSWNKYGELNFEFLVLEEITLEEVIDNTYLTDLEQIWLDAFQPDYNIRIIAESNLGITFTEDHKHKISVSNSLPYYFVSPEGKQYSGNNTLYFCKEHDLSDSTMIQVKNGNKKQYKGWTNSLENYKILQRYESFQTFSRRKQNMYLIKHIKTNKIFPVFSAEKFRRENDLNSKFSRLLLGKVKTCYGYKLLNTKNYYEWVKGGEVLSH